MDKNPQKDKFFDDSTAKKLENDPLFSHDNTKHYSGQIPDITFAFAMAECLILLQKVSKNK